MLISYMENDLGFLEQHPSGVSPGVTAELPAANGVAEVECRRLVRLDASSRSR